MLPVDLTAKPPELQPSVWAVVWWIDRTVEQVSFFTDNALANAAARARHGQIVPLAALKPWPERPL